MSYEYDLAGNRTRTTSANQVVSYGFDELNRLRTVRSGTPANPPTASTPAHEYEYAANGMPAEVRPNGTRTEYAHNVRNQLTSPRYARLAALVHKAAAGALLLGLSYGVDATGLRNSITETVDGGVLSRVTAYDYDDNKRLIREEITRAGQTGSQVTSWVYDRLPAVTSLRSGNRVSQTVDGATLNYTYDANDRLLTESDGTSHVYDNNGNLVRTEKGSATQRYSWDSSGRLSEHTDAAGTRTAYSYDPERSEATAGSGIRVYRTSRLGEADAERTAYLIDYLQPYAQVLEEAAGPATSSALSHQVAYVHGDDLIAQVRGGVAQHYHYDALGSTRLLSGSGGVVSDRYAYTAYGELDAAGSSVVSENAYRYTGEQFDSALGMYYLPARWYDPSTGRFHSQDAWLGNSSDPITLHKYLYANADPANGIDPSGYMTITEVNMAMGEVAELSQKTISVVNSINRAQSLMDIIDAVKTIGQLAEGVIAGRYSHFLPDAQFAMTGLNTQDASKILARNIPSILSRAFPKWFQYLSGIGRSDVKGFVIYLPKPDPAILPQTHIPTPLRIGQKRKPVKIVAGGTNHPGRLIGVGLDIPRDPPGTHQMWRMDYHSWHRGGATRWANRHEIAVWQDDSYHFHVCKPPQGGC